MSFNILYVENNDRDWRPVAEAVGQFNDKATGERLHIERARNPDELNDKLDLRFDAILADVYYDDPRTAAEDIDDRLDDIIRYVSQWKSRQSHDRLLPIIAYTGMGANALKRCLALKDRLYDIWDKNTTLPEYIAWRLSRLAIEVARHRPDAKMQKLVSEMPRGARWHDHVTDMVRRYDAGWTERDQVHRAGNAIENIAHQLGVWEQCQPMWEIMKQWEWMGRAASPHVRGHARHVINVFWLGYYLLHHPALESFFKKAWTGILADREKMNPVKSVKYREGLSDTWFYAGLFHDVAGCVEKAHLLFDRNMNLAASFFGEASNIDNPWMRVVGDLEGGMMSVVDDFEGELRDRLVETLRQDLVRGVADHGLVAAMYLRRSIKDQEQGCFAREAGRAIALHNLFPALPDDVAAAVGWEKEPVACLLLLCDQLQTWDRERGDEALSDEDRPQRAELADVEVTNGRRPHIKLRIDYIPPSHVARSGELFERVRDELERIIKSKPHRALRKIDKPWPFGLKVECSLNGLRLGTMIEL